MWRRLLCSVVLMSSLVAGGAAAADTPTVSVGGDLYSRYVWRGADIGGSPSIQPALSLTCRGFQLGAWGAYSLSQESAEKDEIDFWLSYSVTRESGVAIKLIATDYYFPGAAIPFSRSDAHTLETGLLITGPERFPLTAAGYVNVSNDDGNNMYFQLEYPVSVGDAGLGFFVGAAGGSRENPGYYGTDEVNVINMGMSARRVIAVTDRLSLPLTGWLIYNPRVELAYFVVGLTL